MCLRFKRMRSGASETLSFHTPWPVVIFAAGASRGLWTIFGKWPIDSLVKGGIMKTLNCILLIIILLIIIVIIVFWKFLTRSLTRKDWLGGPANCSYVISLKSNTNHSFKACHTCFNEFFFSTICIISEIFFILVLLWSTDSQSQFKSYVTFVSLLRVPFLGPLFKHNIDEASFLSQAYNIDVVLVKFSIFYYFCMFLLSFMYIFFVKFFKRLSDPSILLKCSAVRQVPGS